jgi:hypothetical protein
VHACYSDAVFQAHQLSQHFGARDHRNVTGVRGGNFRIVARDSGAGDDDFSSGEIFSAMTFKRNSAQSGKTMCDGRGLEVGARDLETKVKQHLGDTTHANAADAYEMDALDFGEHERTKNST